MRVEDIPIKRKGDPLLHQEVNALAQHAKAQLLASQRWGDYEGSKQLSRSRWLEATNGSDETVPAYSVFGLYAATTALNDPPRITIHQIGLDSDQAVHLGLFTNGDEPIPVGATGHCKPVNLWETTRLRATGVTAGMWCGPDPIGSWELTANRFGFFCLGLSVIANVVEVIRAVEPITVVVMIEGCIPAANGPVMGSGMGSVFMRRDGEELEPANLPPVPVYNVCEFPVGVDDEMTFVQCGAALGVGLVIMPCGPGRCGSESTSGSIPPLPSSSSSFFPQPSSSGSIFPPPSESSSAPLVTPSSSESGACISSIGGVVLADLPTGIPAYILGWDADGCAIKVPVGSCQTSSGS